MFCDPLTPQLLYYLGIKDQEIINLYIIGRNCCVAFPQDQIKIMYASPVHSTSCLIRYQSTMHQKEVTSSLCIYQYLVWPGHWAKLHITRPALQNRETYECINKNYETYNRSARVQLSNKF